MNLLKEKEAVDLKQNIMKLEEEFTLRNRKAIENQRDIFLDSAFEELKAFLRNAGFEILDGDTDEPPFADSPPVIDFFQITRFTADYNGAIIIHCDKHSDEIEIDIPKKEKHKITVVGDLDYSPYTFNNSVPIDTELEMLRTQIKDLKSKLNQINQQAFHFKLRSKNNNNPYTNQFFSKFSELLNCIFN